jgi:hypothetical protein
LRESGSSHRFGVPRGNPVVHLSFIFGLSHRRAKTEEEQAARLRGSGQPVSNGVSFAGASRIADNLGFVSITIRPGPTFRRCDTNNDTFVDFSDGITTLRHIILGDDMTTCLPAADCNGQGGFDLTDAIFTLQFVFFGGVAPPRRFQTVA